MTINIKCNGCTKCNPEPDFLSCNNSLCPCHRASNPIWEGRRKEILEEAVRQANQDQRKMMGLEPKDDKGEEKMPELAKQSLSCLHKFENIGNLDTFYCKKCGSSIERKTGQVIPPLALSKESMVMEKPKEEKCGFMILTPHYYNGHNGGMWCAEKKPCKYHPEPQEKPKCEHGWVNTYCKDCPAFWSGQKEPEVKLEVLAQNTKTLLDKVEEELKRIPMFHRQGNPNKQITPCYEVKDVLKVLEDLRKIVV